MGLGPGCKGRDFFMPHVQPLDVLVLSNDIGQAVQRIADDAVDAPHTSRNQCLDEDVTHGSCHNGLSPAATVGPHMQPILAKRERIHLDAGIEESDLEGMVADGTSLADELIETLLR